MQNELKEEYYSQTVQSIVLLLRKHARSDNTRSEYDAFFDMLINDDLFSEGIEHCCDSRLTPKTGFLIKLIRKKNKTLTYLIFNIEKLMARVAKI